ncbi:putative phage transcription regulator [Escherichia coli]|uniref:Putative phage transcription regulator n=1 Tax=Escherichia coli TaxID=562 RepID=A0A376ZY81_ECOLX|nr:putative phage transcription regulator [Escherichia coli]
MTEDLFGDLQDDTILAHLTIPQRIRHAFRHCWRS